MSLESVQPGKYDGIIKRWGLRENERLNGALEAWIRFGFTSGGGEEEIEWNGLVLTKEGQRNKKTFGTLTVCGLADEDLIRLMDEDGLKKDVPVAITIVDKLSRDGSKVYKTVEWVNDINGSGPGAAVDRDAMAAKLAALGLGPKTTQPKKVKNHAPGAEDDVNAEFGF